MNSTSDEKKVPWNEEKMLLDKFDKIEKMLIKVRDSSHYIEGVIPVMEGTVM